MQDTFILRNARGPLAPIQWPAVMTGSPVSELDHTNPSNPIHPSLMGFIPTPCPECKATTMIQTGSCAVCTQCGTTLGCS